MLLLLNAFLVGGGVVTLTPRSFEETYRGKHAGALLCVSAH